MSDSFLHPQESGLASLFAERRNPCRIVIKFAVQKAICYTGGGTAWVLLTEVAPVLGQCLTGKRSSTGIC